MNDTNETRKLWTEKQCDDPDHRALILAHEHELAALLADEDEPWVERDNLIELAPEFILDMEVCLEDVPEVPKWALESLFEAPRIYQPIKTFGKRELAELRKEDKDDPPHVCLNLVFQIKASEFIANYDGPCHVVFPPYSPDIDPNADVSRD
jgi:hypothetical protein